jgi:hypothetical protein
MCYTPRVNDDASLAAAYKHLAHAHDVLRASVFPSPANDAIVARIAAAAACVRVRTAAGGLPPRSPPRAAGGGGDAPPARTRAANDAAGSTVSYGSSRGSAGGGGDGGGGAPAWEAALAAAAAAAAAAEAAEAARARAEQEAARQREAALVSARAEAAAAAAAAEFGGAPPWRRLLARGLPPDAEEEELCAHVQNALARAQRPTYTKVVYCGGAHLLDGGAAMLVFASDALATAACEQMTDSMLLRGCRLTLARPVDYRKPPPAAAATPLRLNVVREERGVPLPEVLTVEEALKKRAAESAAKRGGGGGGGGGGAPPPPPPPAAAAPAKALSAKEQKKVAERALAERKAAEKAALTSAQRALAERVRAALTKAELQCLQAIAQVHDAGSAQDVSYEVACKLLARLGELGAPVSVTIKADQINVCAGGENYNLARPRGHHLQLMLQHFVGDLRKMLPIIGFPLAAFDA